MDSLFMLQFIPSLGISQKIPLADMLLESMLHKAMVEL